MARVKVCSACDQSNAESEFFCNACGTSLADIAARETDGSARNIGEAEASRAERPRRTHREPAAAAASAALEFPWGRVKVNGRLNVGRDPEFSPLAQMLAHNEYVSGRHAEVCQDLNRTWLRDIGTKGNGSTNGTYVNGKQVTPLEIVSLADGDEVGFSRHLTAIVRLS